VAFRGCLISNPTAWVHEVSDLREKIFRETFQPLCSVNVSPRLTSIWAEVFCCFFKSVYMRDWSGVRFTHDPATSLKVSRSEQRRQDGMPTNFPPIAHVLSLPYIFQSLHHLGSHCRGNRRLFRRFYHAFDWYRQDSTTSRPSRPKIQFYGEGILDYFAGRRRNTWAIRWSTPNATRKR